MLDLLQGRWIGIGTEKRGIRAKVFFERCSQCRKLWLAVLRLGAGSISIRRLKGSLFTVQPVYQHRGQPLLDETAALRAWLRKRSQDGSDYLLTSQKGGKLSRIQFFRVFQTVGKSAGLSVESGIRTC
jgi:hypothetical protein